MHEADYEAKAQMVHDMIRISDGNDMVFLYLAEEKAVKQLGRNETVCADVDLINEFKAKLGEKNVKVREKTIEKMR